MKTYIYENKKLKYFFECDDGYRIDYSKKKIYMQLNGQCFAPLLFQKIKIKGTKLLIFSKEIKINFDYNWGM